MKKQKAGLVAAALGCLCMFAGLNACKAANPYNFIKEIPLHAGGGGAMAVDVAGKRLYAVCSNEIDIIDLQQQAVIAQITNTPVIGSLALMPKHPLGFISSTEENELATVNFGRMQIVSTIKTGPGPAAVLCDPGMILYSFNKGDRTATVYEADDGDSLGAIPLPGIPGALTFDPKLRRIYCCINDKDEVCVIDGRIRKVSAHWPVAPGFGVDGIAVDTISQRLFVTCTNKTLVVMNSVSGKVISSVPIETAGNSVAFDPVNKFVVSCGGNGAVTIAHQDTPDKLTVAQTLPHETGARAVAIDPSAHKMYLSVDGKVLVYGKTTGY